MAHDDFTRSRKVRSVAWSFLEVYCQDEGSEGDLLCWCRLCASLGVSTTLYLQKKAISNAFKLFENASMGDASGLKQMVHARAALDICQNPTGGTRSKRAIEGSISRFISAAQRLHNLRFVLMLVMTRSPHVLTSNSYVNDFVSGLSSTYSTPSPSTMLKLMVELYACVLERVCSRAKQVKALYNSLPFALAVMDLWTEKQSQVSYGSIVLRFVDPLTTTMEVMLLGISVFRGKHTNDKVLSWFKQRLQYLGLGSENLGSTTTDSGPSVRKAMRRMKAPSLPCTSPSLHNTVMDALGDERGGQ